MTAELLNAACRDQVSALSFIAVEIFFPVPGLTEMNLS